MLWVTDLKELLIVLEESFQNKLKSMEIHNKNSLDHSVWLRVFLCSYSILYETAFD